MGPKQGSLPGGCCLGSVLPAHARGVAPEPFEIAVGAFFGFEHVHDDVDVVEEPPPRAGFALAPGRTYAEPSPHPIFDALDHRLLLPRVARGADQHEVAYRG